MLLPRLMFLHYYAAAILPLMLADAFFIFAMLP